MAPLIPSAKAILSYPLYACDFDPQNSSRLVVGGGGGAGRSGVGNKITLLDTSSSSELQEITEIDLSKEEDNVTSLAVGQKQGQATLVYAGVNSSLADVGKGKNAHFRVFGIEAVGASPKKKGRGKPRADAQVPKPGAIAITEISRASLFQGTEQDVYQRILRLTRPYPNQPQLGAVATGMAKTSEIVLFDTSATSPPISRGAVQSNKEAVDVDFIQTGEHEYRFAYCDVHDIYVKTISKNTDPDEPELVYETPASKSVEKVTVPSFRAMRWLTPDLLLMLTNIHSNSGVVLQILRLREKKCIIVQSLRLSSRLSKATGVAVANLTPPVSPSEVQGYTQFVIAVAGQDFSISLFKVDLQVEAGSSMISGIRAFRTFNQVHPFTITGLTFSNFVPPAHPITASTPPQYLKLASVSVNNTVVVYTLPLFPVPLSVKRGQSKTPRYVVALPSTTAAFGFAALLSFFAILIGAIFIQGLLEVRGGVPVWLKARDYVPMQIQELVGRPYEFPSGYSSIPTSVPSEATAPSVLPEFLQKIQNRKEGDVYVITDYDGADGSKAGVQAHVHDERNHPPHGGKEWHELHDERKELWKQKLKDAGYWAEDMGETLFKGVVFGELGGAIGGAVGQAVAGG